MNISNDLNPAALFGKPQGNSKLDADSFMKMLLAQLKAQDPTKPFDASTMMQQIAQLTGLTATQQMSENVKDLKGSAGISQMLEASQIVGKRVQLATNTLELKSGQAADAAVVVPEGVENIQVSIYDSSGNKIRTLDLKAPADGVLDFSWDGLNQEGKAVEAGFYSMEAKTNINGQEQQLPTASAYTINSVALDRSSSKVILNVNGLGGVTMDDVVKIL